MKRFFFFGAIAIALTGTLILSQHRHEPLTVSGFVEADEIRVGSRVGGRVHRVLVEEGNEVQAGDLLIELEPFDLLERKAQAQQTIAQTSAALARLQSGFRQEEKGQAESRVAQIEAELQKLKNGPREQEIAAAESRVRLAESELELARKSYQRMESLFGRQAADKSDIDEASTKLQVAQASVDVASSELALLKEGTRQEDIAKGEAQLKEAEQSLALFRNGYRQEEIREAEAKHEAALAALKILERQIDELKVTAPTHAYVESINLRPGDLVGANAPAVSLADPDRLWVRAYVPEDRLDVSPGMQVQVRVDSYPERTFTGEITFVARHAEFTPSNVQTPEERSRQVFRIRVRLIDDQELLRPGMAADVILGDRRSSS